MRITTQSHFLFPFQDYIVPKSKASFFRALFLAFSSFFKMYCENTPDFLSLRYVIMILLFQVLFRAFYVEIHMPRISNYSIMNCKMECIG